MKKNILIIDDSALMRRIISDIINSDNRFFVSKTVGDGVRGLDLLLTNEYDCAILDINMPKMNGLELLTQLRKYKVHTKIIIVSTVVKEGANETIKALELGAFDFVTKPDKFYETKSNSFRVHLLNAVSIATQFASADTEVLKSIQKEHIISDNSHASVVRNRFNSRKVNKDRNVLVAIACSTGGPKALQSIIPMIPSDFAAPILCVQHMPPGFTNSLAARLDEISNIHVKEAEEGDRLVKGNLYLAKGGKHLKVKKTSSGCQLEFGTEAPVNGLRPCADIMYQSLCYTDYDEIVGVVLTGMGNDGTKGLMELGKLKNLYVVAQDMESSVVYGMPKSVVKAGLVDEIKPLGRIIETIIKHVGVQ